ncbi:hypothetical protein BDR07DRAFT_743744 [Suillus spraguei]|nr:hypothetical protein BDR07DRAFT_743744 [Suillus spraguei]
MSAQARIDISCRVLNCVPAYPSLHMWDTGIYWKIFSQARRSQHNDRSALREVQRFRFTVEPPWNPAVPSQVWHHRIWWKVDAHSPEDFDWLVDYLGDVCSSDQNTAGNILVLLSSMEVSCSPAKQRPFIEALITCMGSSMPPVYVMLPFALFAVPEKSWPPSTSLMMRTWF